jgi:hypothetical protein
LIIRLGFAAVLLSSPALFASPTSEEFLPCHKAASAVLQACLDKRPGVDDAACWTESRRANAACYTHVRQSHQRPDKARTQAAAKAAADRAAAEAAAAR